MNQDELYSRRLTRVYPGLFIILLDQSYSMTEPIVGQKQTKADVATGILNTIIFEMITAAGSTREGDNFIRKKNAYLSILGYNDTVYPLLSSSDIPMDIPYLAEFPKGYTPISRGIEISPGNFKQIPDRRPYWVKPQGYGNTDMAKAFERAGEIALRWIQSQPEDGQASRQECFPPVIINITDAKHNGEGDHVGISYKIRDYGTHQGKILIFNCHFTEILTQPYIFPGNINEVAHLDHDGFAINMFQMSSIIPKNLRNDAARFMPGQQNTLPENARCFVYNANADILIKFLRWGTLRAPIQTEPGTPYR